MSTIATDPSLHIWWLASRAAGIVALGLITASVMLGLAMANKLLRGRNYAAIHEHLSVAGLVAILAHGVTLLGDSWLHPGLVGIAVPFTMGYRTVFTGLGIMAGLGAGTDASTSWLRTFMLATGVPILALIGMRLRPGRSSTPKRQPRARSEQSPSSSRA